MNYLGHYFLSLIRNRDNKESSLYYSFGNILPDLARNYKKKYRIKESQNDVLPEEYMAEINEGVKDHFKTDRLFHNSSFFYDYVKLIQTELRSVSLSYLPKRLYFIAHVLLELLLDRVLIKNEMSLCDNFYLSLSKITVNKISLYIKMHQFIDDTKGFIAYFNRFIEKNYIYGYTSNNKIIFALGMVIERTGNNGFISQDHSKLKNVIDSIERKLVIEYKNIFYEINDKMA